MLKPTKAGRGEGNDMSDLATRIEQATGPDRELDAEIAEKSGQYKPDRHRPGMFFKVAGCDTHSSYGVPSYTASIDAAMTLVPEGWRIEAVMQEFDGNWYAELSGPNLSVAEGRACTEVLARLAAAIRARS